jgi:hypothetical protein
MPIWGQVVSDIYTRDYNRYYLLIVTLLAWQSLGGAKVLGNSLYKHHYPLSSSKVAKVVGSIAMDVKQLQSIETGLHKQVEATQATNELIAKLFSIMSTLQVKDIAIPPPASVLPTPPVITTSKVSHTLQIKPGTPNNFNGYRVQGCACLTSVKGTTKNLSPT